MNSQHWNKDALSAAIRLGERRDELEKVRPKVQAVEDRLFLIGLSIKRLHATGRLHNADQMLLKREEEE